MDLQLGFTAYVRERGSFPELPVINMFAEQTPTEGTYSLISRPGLSTSFVTNVAPVDQIFQNDGVLGGGIFSAAGAKLYSGSDLLSSFTSAGHVTLLGFNSQLVVAAGGPLYAWNGVSMAAITTPDDFNVISAAVAASRLVVLKENSSTFYWSDVLSNTIDALSFATTENAADINLDIIFQGDRLIIFGRETTETWVTTTDPDLPYTPLKGAGFPVGIKNTGAVSTLGSTFAWVTDRNQVCLSSPENVISFPGLNEKIYRESEAKLWNFFIRGSEYLGLSFGDETWIYSPDTKTWAQFQSYEVGSWIAGCASGEYFGSVLDGSVLTWSDSYFDDTLPLERRCRAWAGITSENSEVNNLIVRVNTGDTTYLTGPFADPTIEMRASRDGGRTWDSWRPRSLGTQGEYSKQVFWNGCGLFDYPGLLFEFRVTDPVSFRISSAIINESIGGMN